MKQHSIVEGLKEYLSTTPREEIEAAWARAATDAIGPTAKEFIKYSKQQIRRMKKYTKALRKVVMRALKLGFVVVQSKELDPYFKGDLNGAVVWIEDMDDDLELFNVLHLLGHCIQWNVDEELLALGNKIWVNPDDETIKKLQEYEWEANCYALQILHDCKVFDLDDWLLKSYQADMIYLTNFYLTGEKHEFLFDKEVEAIREKYPFKEYLVAKPIPKFTPKAFEKSRNGIVI